MSTPKFCMGCGGGLKAGAKFCAECGAQVVEPAAEATESSESASSPVAAAPAAKAEASKPAAAPASATAATEESKRPSAPSLGAPAPVAPVDPKAAGYKGSLASLIGSERDDDDAVADHLELPKDGAVPVKRGLAVGSYVLIGFLVVILGAALFIGNNEELNARFRCNVMGQRASCVTEADRIFEIEQAEKKEEIELMIHHYGGFDLNYTPENDSSFTVRQHRYEEPRADFVKRIREGAADARVRKITKVGVYSEKKGEDGIIKGMVAFAESGAAVTYTPTVGKHIVLPLSLTELPLLEREQVDGNGKRLSADDVARIEKAKEVPVIGDDGRPVQVKIKVKTLAISTWVYEIALTAPGYKPRTVMFYENPVPPDLDVKKLEAEGITMRPFKRRPDGRFVIDNASFDLLPEPRTLWTRYVQTLKEIHCLQQSVEYKGKSDQGKTDAESLLWEQKAFNAELIAIAHQNDEDPEWIAYKEEQFKGYSCPKL